MEIHNIETICYYIILGISSMYGMITFFNYTVYNSMTTKNFLAFLSFELSIIVLNSLRLDLIENGLNRTLVTCVLGVLIVIISFVYRIYYKENIMSQERLLEDEPFLRKIASLFKKPNKR